VNIAETIDAFRRGSLELDCPKMTLKQVRAGGACFEGPGYIRQAADGGLSFKIYVIARENAHPFATLAGNGAIGKLHADDSFFELTAITQDGTALSANRILPVPHWNLHDDTLQMLGPLQSIVAFLERNQPDSYLRLHFFEEYEVPLFLASETEIHGVPYAVVDRAKFESAQCEFEVRRREGSGETILEVNSVKQFPRAFNLRLQEALQYITARSAFWRARIERTDRGLEVELTSPLRKSSHTQMDPPLSRFTGDWRTHTWPLFCSYLAYVVAKTDGTHWNPVAYHHYNATESSANSVDAWAIGVSVAVEAVTSLITLESPEGESKKLSDFRKAICEFVAGLPLYADFAPRITGLLNSMNNKRPQDVLHALAKKGRVEKNYISAWSHLRNRHVHPKLKDLNISSPIDYQQLLDNIHRTEVLLRQLTFHLIGYEGMFTDYGAENWPSKRYPLAIDATWQPPGEFDGD
jgi:hypothetical protein